MHTLRTIVVLITFASNLFFSQMVSASSIVGRAWLDVNQNGLDDANEPGLGGIALSLYDYQNTVINWVVTDSTGQYQFNELPASDYIVCVDIDRYTSEYKITKYRAGENKNIDNDASPNYGCTIYTTINDISTTVSNIDFGFISLLDVVQPEPEISMPPNVTSETPEELLTDQSAPVSSEIQEPAVVDAPEEVEPISDISEALEPLTDSIVPRSSRGRDSILNIIASVPVGRWVAVPGSQLDFLRACPTETDIDSEHAYLAAPNYKWNFYCAGLINAENGAAFDAQANRMLVWGGGHADYAGNEVYAYNLSGPNPGWEHLNLPSPLPDQCDMRGGNHCAGMGSIEYLMDSPNTPNRLVPASRHTLDTLQFIPEMGEQGSLWAYSGAVWQGGFVSAATWSFDTAQQSWTEHRRWNNTFPEVNPDITARPANILQGLDVFSVRDPITGSIYAHGNRRLKKFDPVSKEWTLLTDDNNVSQTSVHSTAAYDYEHKKLVVIGGSADFVISPSYYDIIGEGSEQKAIYHKLISTGDNEIEFTDGPGIDYDPDANVFVAWHGGRSIYVLNMQVDQPRWEQILLEGDDPGPSAIMGTFGRLRYVPDKKMFMLINRVAVEDDGFTLIKTTEQANVFFFRLPARFYANGVVPEPEVAAPVVIPGDTETPASALNQNIKHLYPLGNLANALAELIPGDTLIIHEGEHFIDKYVAINQSATAAAPIIIQGAEGENRPLISTRVHVGENTFNIIGNSSYITVKGLEVTNGNHEDAFKLSGGHISHVTLEDLDIHNVSIGIRVATDADHIIIRDNHIHNTGQRRLDENGSLRGFSTGEGMYIGCYRGDCIVSDSIVENNLIHDSDPDAEQGDGIEFKTRSHDNIIRDNVVYNMGSATFGDYGGILVWGWSEAEDTGGWGDNIIERNVVWGKGSIRDVGIEAVSHAQVRNNIIFDVYTGLASNPQFDGGSPYLNIPVKDVNIVNNTVTNSRIAARLIWEATDNAVFANNIIQSTNPSEGYAVECRSTLQGTFAKNVFQGRFSCPTPEGGFAGFIENNVLSSQFQSFANNNYWLNSGASTLIGNGAIQFAPVDDFNGSQRNNPIDIGAYQTSGQATNPGWLIQSGSFKLP